MVFTSKNRVYDVVDETNELAVTGELKLSSDNLATLNGRATGKNGLGDCSFHLEEYDGGQVSVGFSGCPVCAGKLYPVLQGIVASAKEQLTGKADAGKTTPSETTETVKDEPKAPKMFEKTGADEGQAGDNGSEKDAATVPGEQEATGENAAGHEDAQAVPSGSGDEAGKEG